MEKSRWPVSVADGLGYRPHAAVEGAHALACVVEATPGTNLTVRIANHGQRQANSVMAEVYCVPVATLLTPELWKRVGATELVHVPAGHTVRVAATAIEGGPITHGGQCRYVALAGPKQPPQVPQGPPSFDWYAFCAFLRAYHNVAWRNVSIEENIPGPDETVPYPFLLTNAPDIHRRYNLEVVRNLPADVELNLAVPLALGREWIRQAPCTAVIDQKRDELLLRVPTESRLVLRNVSLAAGARLPCRFVVRGSRQLQAGGYYFGLRQLFRNHAPEAIEVGAVWWEYLRKGGEGAG